MSLDWDDEDEIEHDEKKIEDPGSPWEGAVIYKRNALILHQEYCTTLERLGLGRISTDISKNKASVMGLRVAKAVKDYPNGTPVQVSVDVTRKKKKLRLDGIIKTVITLPCNRYFYIFLDFTLLNIWLVTWLALKGYHSFSVCCVCVYILSLNQL